MRGEMVDEPEFLGRGWGFPVQPTPRGRLPWAEGEDKIRQSIWLILSTAKGERQMRTDFGCGIHDLTFTANTDDMRGLVEYEVRQALLHWEPRIDVLAVHVESPPEARHHLLIQVDYSVRANNAFHNLVYPFFLTEGPR